MKKLGLIGYPLTHSFSKTYFTEKFEKEGLSDQYCYENYPLKTIEDLPALLKSEPDLIGLNVTIPYKELVMPYLTKIDEEASIIKAVNVIEIDENGELYGLNTDCSGFRKTLNEFLMNNGGRSQKALVLGTGGAAKAIIYALKTENISCQSVSRTTGENQITYEDLTPEIMANIDLIINTTPLGMYPNVASSPNIPYHCLTKNHRLYDVVYNPVISTFLQRGKNQGAAIINGLPMLHAQAEGSWDIWTNI